MSFAVASAAQVFRHETDEAKRLGYQLQCRINQNTVAARMQPRTPRAHEACFKASGQPNQAIESSAQVDTGQQPVDALRDAIQSVLERAKEIA